MIHKSKAVLLTLSILLFFVPHTQAEFIDAIVATVDKEAILYSEIRAEIGPEIKRINETVASPQEVRRLSNEVIDVALEEAIDAKILAREAKRYSVEVTDAEVEQYVDDMRVNFETEEAFINELQAFGETLSDFRERTRKQKMAQRLAVAQIRFFEDEVVVSDQAIAQYHEDRKEEFEIPEKVLVRQIFLRVKQDPAERAKARTHLELLLKEIEGGTDFAELAKVHSQAGGAEEGGIMGWHVKGDLVQPLEEAAFSLANGENSGVLETLGGLHLLKVDEYVPTNIAPLEDVRLEIEHYLRAIEAQKKYKVWLNDLRKRSRVQRFR